MDWNFRSCAGGQAGGQWVDPCLGVRSTSLFSWQRRQTMEAGGQPAVLRSLNNYVEYRPGSGSWPVVLSAPHGGDLMPTAVPDRTGGVAEPDWKSYELAEGNFTRNLPLLVISRFFFEGLLVLTAVYEAFQAAGGSGDEGKGAPALVSLMLDRRKMDGNRARCGRFQASRSPSLWPIVGLTFGLQGALLRAADEHHRAAGRGSAAAVR